MPSWPAAAFVVFAFAFVTPTKKVSFVSVSIFVHLELGLPSPVPSYKNIKHKAHQSIFYLFSFNSLLMCLLRKKIMKEFQTLKLYRISELSIVFPYNNQFLCL